MGIEAVLQVVIFLSLPWVALELIARLRHNLSHRSGGAVLSIRKPTPSLRAGGEAGRPECGFSVSRGRLWVKVETSSLNNLPRWLLDSFTLRRLARRGDAKKIDRKNHKVGIGEESASSNNALLDYFYELGVWLAGAALLASILFLIFATFDLIGQIVNLSYSASRDDGTTGNPSALRKRDSASTNVAAGSASWTPSLVPLIPGLTLPLNHLVPLTVALAITQVVHEAGHAICGTLYDWIPLRMGFILIFPCIPGAFVTLPNEALDTSAFEGDDETDLGHERNANTEEESVKGQLAVLKKQLRTVSAGVWHNALSALWLTVLLTSGVGSLCHSILWEQSSGLIVESVDATSPLAVHLLPGTLITQLNDDPLHDTAEKPSSDSLVTWEALLVGDKSKQEDTLGWCVPTSQWQAQSARCCDRLSVNKTTEQDSDSPSPCFREVKSSSRDVSDFGHCYDPVLLIGKGRKAQRCKGICDPDSKGRSRSCIRPDPGENLIRITVKKDKDNSTSRVILFQGSKASVFAAATVSAFRFRYEAIFRLNYSTFLWATLLVTYTLNLSLAMALFNMLPLPALDGDVYLDLFLRLLVIRSGDAATSQRFHPDEIDEEESMLAMQPIATGRPISPSSQYRRIKPVKQSTSVEMGSGVMRRRSGLPVYFNMATVKQIQRRLRWLIIVLAVFVFGGTILLHAIVVSA